MCRLIVCLILASIVQPAFGCINDIELPVHEREFRSRYRDSNSPRLPVSPSDRYTTTHQLLGGIGVALGGVAVALAWIHPRQEK